MPSKKESLVDMVHNSILEIIIREKVSEESVFTEGRLVQQFEVSKATVREALVRLCNENILKSIPRYGYVIVRLSERDIEDLQNFRLLIETDSLTHSFQNIKENISKLEQLLSIQNTAENANVWDTWKKNIAFHSLLTSFSGNGVYVKYLEETMHRQALYFAQNKWRGENTFGDHINSKPHQDIVLAIKNNDQKKALYSLESDIKGANQNI